MQYVDDKICAQGDMLIRKIDKLPEGAVLDEGENGKFILTHSESGHNHSVKKKEGVQFYQSANDNLVAWLVVNNTECLVEHERSFDTHAPIGFKEGVYEIRRQIESDDSPEGWRRAID